MVAAKPGGFGIVGRILDQARRNAVDGDTRAKFERQCLGQTDQPCFRRHDVHAVTGTHMGGDAADIDDATGCALNQVRVGRVGAEKSAVQNDAHGLSPFPGAQLVQLDRASDGCVIDQDVETAELGDGKVNEPLRLLGYGDVCQLQHRAAARSLDQFDGLLAIGPIAACMHHHRGASGRQF